MTKRISVPSDRKGQEFSARLNELLDFCGFIEGRGRLRDVRLLLNISGSTAHNWLNGICPRPHTLSSIVDCLVQNRLLPKEIDRDHLSLWLEKGSPIIANPLVNKQKEPGNHKAQRNAVIAEYGRRCLTIFNEAETLKIDLSKMRPAQLGKKIVEILETIESSKNSADDQTLIRELLLQMR